MKNIYPTDKKQTKVLKILLRTEPNYNGEYVIDFEFCKLFKMEHSDLLRTLTALHAKGAITLISEDADNPFPRVELLPKAYTYIPDKLESSFRFWIPVVISIAALLLAITSLWFDALQLAYQLQKQI